MTLWRVAPAGRYEWRAWAGQAVVFVHATGDTHALSPETTTLLVAMRSRPDECLSAPQWYQLAGLVTDAELEDHSLIRALEAIGLASPAKP